MMREAGILSNNNRIQVAILSPRLKSMIEDANPTELAIFPGASMDGV
jgi:hypothetical protein